MYKLWLKDRFVCFSPEIFVRIEKGKIKSFPMKGTIDATLPDAEQLLMQDTKEAAEHATIVDLIRNDLSMVSEHVEVTSYRYIDRLQTNKGPILQTSSEICGTLPEDYTAHLGDIIFRLLPAGSITGAPKPKTVEIIAQARRLPPGLLHRHHGALCRRTAGQRCHDTLHRAGKRPAPLQGRRRHHRQKPVGKRIQRSNTENICGLFIETIRIDHGRVCNLSRHNRRLNDTRAHFWPESTPLQLSDYLSSPGCGAGITGAGIVKARVVYGEKGIEDLSYSPYAVRHVHSLALMQADTIDYTYKAPDANR